mgnify:CR=1 FL=1
MGKIRAELEALLEPSSLLDELFAKANRILVSIGNVFGDPVTRPPRPMLPRSPE